MNQQHVYRFISRADIDDDSLTQALLNLGGVVSISRIMTLTGCTNFVEVTLDHKIEQRQEWSCAQIYPKVAQPAPSTRFEGIIVPMPSYVPITVSTHNPPEDSSTNISVKIEVPSRNTIKATIFNNGTFLDESTRNLQKEEITFLNSEKLCIALLHAMHQFKNLLLDSNFKLIAEIDPLQYLNSIQNPAIHHIRWIKKLQRFNYTCSVYNNSLTTPIDVSVTPTPNSNEFPPKNEISSSDSPQKRLKIQ